MKYLLAFLCPPLAIAMTGRIYLAFFNALFWPPSLWIIVIIALKGIILFGAPPTVAGATNLKDLAWMMLSFSTVDWFSFIWIIPTVHALFIVHGQDRDKRHAEILAAQKQTALMQQGLIRQMAQRPQVVVVQAPPQPRHIPQPRAGKQLPPQNQQ